MEKEKTIQTTNQNDLISVIMPVYKVENFLARTIESVLNQTYKNIELILVDDGSPDNCGKICDEYGLKDNRVKVIHQENGGAPIARNNALDIAKGVYVCFFDSDDWVDDDMIEFLHNMCKKYDLNLAVSGFYIDTFDLSNNKNGNNFFTLNYIPNDKIYLDKETFRKDAYLYFDKNMFYPPWNKLYKKSYLDNNNVRFKKTYRDDFPFVLDSIKDISHIGFTSKQFYHFQRARSESETSKYIPNLYDKRQEEHEMMISLLKYWNLYPLDANSMDMLSRRYLDRVIECIENFTSEKCTLSKKEIKENVKNILNCSYIDESLKYARPAKFYLKLMYLPIKFKNINMCLLQSKFITYIKKHYLFLFNQLKVGRN